MNLSALLAAVLSAFLAAPPPSPPPLVVRARGLDGEALRDALRPRSGGAEVILLGDAEDLEQDHILIDVERRPPALVITIRLGDGRTFTRSAPASAEPRDAARVIAAMLPTLAGAGTEHRPGREDDPQEPPSPSPVAPARAADLPAETPRGRAAPAAATAPPDLSPMSSETPSSPRRGLDLSLDGGPLLGLAPSAAGLVAGSVGLGLHLRGARPWLVSAGLRSAHLRAHPFTLTRLRVGVAVGTSLRRGRFELDLTAGFGVEPWLVTRGGQRAHPETYAPEPVLLGGMLRLAPSFALPGRLRLGLFAELAVSGAANGRPLELYASGQPRFTLGGLELSLGLELRLRVLHARARRSSSL